MDRFDLMLPRVRPGAGPGEPREQQPQRAEGGKPFDEVLQEAQAKVEKVRFSAHALDRLSTRGLDLDAGELAVLAGALDRLEDRGGTQSLVLMPKAALVVNVPNRTVITAVERAEDQGRVFTHIDSAVVLG